MDEAKQTVLFHSMVKIMQEVYPKIINETEYRNFCIKEDFNTQRWDAKFVGDSVTQVLFQLAEKYNISYEQINKIVYSK